MSQGRVSCICVWFRSHSVSLLEVVLTLISVGVVDWVLEAVSTHRQLKRWGEKVAVMRNECV